ncbi:DUF1648 domain-containing protein [Paenibacillus sp. 2TAB19]|uniref:DUF1648 domain-containing protein n=1 Tax=Paenibacillus sp. 2TAB19 TaxID=3233003 RepID=UPI003F9E3BF1
MTIERLHDWICFALILLSYVFLIFKWSDLPATIPIHYNARGVADGWGGRATLFILPTIALILYAGLTLLRRIPHHFNYIVQITEQNAVAQYRLSLMLLSWIKLEIVVLFGYIQWSTIQNAAGLSSGLGIWMLPVSLFILLGTILIAITRMRKSR